MTDNKTPANKLRKIRDICNDFKQTIKYKPLDTKMDEARIQSLINDILKVLMHEKFNEEKLMQSPTKGREYWAKQNALEKRQSEFASKENRQLGLKALKQIKEQRNYGGTTES
tara:strand:- start:220 stop:558 length:339 start_codon:yes stop_codon:yes gene_type:complete